MNITITSATHEAFSLQLQYPREFSGLQQLEERHSQKTAAWGNLMIKELWFDGACVFQSTIEAKQSCRLNMQCDNACWLMNFVLAGELATGNGINLKAGQYNCLYCNNLNIEAGIEQTTRIFSVCLTRRFIKHLFWKSHAFKDDELTSGGQTIFVTGNQPITLQLRAIISEINHAKQPSYIRRIYLEGKILELLSLQLKNSIIDHTPSLQPATNPDIDKLETARQLIERNIKRPYSLIELAKKCGLNDFKLKKGFKEIYGHTVFGYLAEIRMQRAITSLQKGATVSEVADEVGYKNAHHFTAAFKKRFEILPSEVLNKN